MSYYRRIEIINGETAEPVQFVGVYVLNWPEGYIPEAAFVEAEDVGAKLAAAEALAEAGKELAQHIEEDEWGEPFIDSRPVIAFRIALAQYYEKH